MDTQQAWTAHVRKSPGNTILVVDNDTSIGLFLQLAIIQETPYLEPASLLWNKEVFGYTVTEGERGSWQKSKGPWRSGHPVDTTSKGR